MSELLQTLLFVVQALKNSCVDHILRIFLTNDAQLQFLVLDQALPLFLETRT